MGSRGRKPMRSRNDPVTQRLKAREANSRMNTPAVFLCTLTLCILSSSVLFIAQSPIQRQNNDLAHSLSNTTNKHAAIAPSKPPPRRLPYALARQAKIKVKAKAKEKVKEKIDLRSLLPDKTVIMAAGMMRSGSTWQYAALTEIFRAAGISAQSVAIPVGPREFNFARKLPTTFETQVLIAKTHYFDQVFLDRAHFVFTSYRDLRDVLSSLIRKDFLGCGKRPVNNYRNCRMMLHDSFVEYLMWLPHAHYNQRYEAMHRDKRKTLADLIRTLKLPIKAFNLTQILHRIDANIHTDRVGLNPDTKDPFFFVSSDHISDHDEPGYYAKFLPPDVISCLNFMYEEWLLQNSYDVNNAPKVRPKSCSVWARHHPQFTHSALRRGS